MLNYSATAVGLIGVVSLLLVYTLKKLALPSYRVVITTGIGSVAVSLLFPGIFKLVSSSATISGGNIPVLNALSISAVVSLILIFIISVTASLMIPDSAFDGFFTRLRKKQVDPEQLFHQEEAAAIEPVQAGGNYLEEIFEKTMNEKPKETADFEENSLKVENNLEISVDREENTDKMGIEAFEPVLPAENLTIDECINEAFRFKDAGDYESAILYFMMALDKKPRLELIFWIVLDICVLYRELNQYELARDILTGYVDVYGELIPADIRNEIENILQYFKQHFQGA